MQSVQDQWKAWIPFLKGMAVGVIVGPIFVLWMGWGVTTGAMEGQVRAALVKAEVAICTARALGENRDAAKLDYAGRTKLAEKWSVMPGRKAGTGDDDVKSGCADKLAEAPKPSAS